MKFTAEFDTPDTADICAAAIRNKVPDITSLTITNRTVYNSGSNIIFPNFSPSINNPQYSIPMWGQFSIRNIDTGMEYDYSRNQPMLEVTSSRENEKMISNIIVGYGGLNIHKF